MTYIIKKYIFAKKKRMKDKDLKNILQNKLKKSISNIQIFEEGIDLETQIEFEKSTKKFLKKEIDDIDLFLNEEKLLSNDTTENEKKEILI